MTNLVWSPGGTHFRFTGIDFSSSASAIWEISTDGSNLHPLFPGWHDPPNECCGDWTADGKYFVFLSNGQVWALPRKGGWLHSESKPIPLTSSPMSLYDPLPSKDGKKLFVVSATTRCELMRCDLKSGKFVPFLGGISVEFLAYSKDGQWLAYVSFPDGTLWRSKADGSERLQLTYSSDDYAFMPQWSPDGKEIVFFDVPVGKPSRIYEISPEGGSPRTLMPGDPHPQQDPNWSPDGNKIVFAGAAGDPASAVHILDLTSGQVSTLPGSQGFYSPRWSPDGRYIPAMSSDSTKLLLFDFQTQKWVELLTGTLGFLNWSKDGKYLIALEQIGVGSGGSVVKIRLSDHKVERIADLKNFVPTGRYNSSLSIAPDDSPVLLRDAGTYDVYSLDWEAP